MIFTVAGVITGNHSCYKKAGDVQSRDVGDNTNIGEKRRVVGDNTNNGGQKQRVVGDNTKRVRKLFVSRKGA